MTSDDTENEAYKYIISSTSTRVEEMILFSLFWSMMLSELVGTRVDAESTNGVSKLQSLLCCTNKFGLLSPVHCECKNAYSV